MAGGGMGLGEDGNELENEKDAWTQWYAAMPSNSLICLVCVYAARIEKREWRRSNESQQYQFDNKTCIILTQIMTYKL